MGRISNDLVGSALIDQGWLISARFRPKPMIYFIINKGKLYAYALLMRDLGADFSNIREKELNTAWAQKHLEQAANMDPVLVMGHLMGSFFQSFGWLGFYLLRARAQMNAIINVLLK